MDIPDDLVQLQRDWFAAEVEEKRVAAGLSPAIDSAGNVAGLTAEHRRQLGEAHGRLLQATEALHAHPWWSTAENRFEAREALRAAAGDAEGPSPK